MRLYFFILQLLGWRKRSSLVISYPSDDIYTNQLVIFNQRNANNAHKIAQQYSQLQFFHHSNEYQESSKSCFDLNAVIWIASYFATVSTDRKIHSRSCIRHIFSFAAFVTSEYFQLVCIARLCYRKNKHNVR